MVTRWVNPNSPKSRSDRTWSWHDPKMNWPTDPIENPTDQPFFPYLMSSITLCSLSKLPTSHTKPQWHTVSILKDKQFFLCKRVQYSAFFFTIQSGMLILIESWTLCERRMAFETLNLVYNRHLYQFWRVVFRHNEKKNSRDLDFWATSPSGAKNWVFCGSALSADEKVRYYGIHTSPTLCICNKSSPVSNKYESRT